MLACSYTQCTCIVYTCIYTHLICNAHHPHIHCIYMYYVCCLSEILVCAYYAASICPHASVGHIPSNVYEAEHARSGDGLTDIVFVEGFDVLRGEESLPASQLPRPPHPTTPHVLRTHQHSDDIAGLETQLLVESCMDAPLCSHLHPRKVCMCVSSVIIVSIQRHCIESMCIYVCVQ